ncbi:MAG TPA: xanthine dehydrogenase family protein subunit M [Candidatus Dormibacteraeota bacterium]|nr:xanthine dehydrogenase family protein subunit M [Candidatus Dormibacteraeota bacterium]
MKPPPFVYHAPGTVAEAATLLHEAGEEGRVLAGGQSLIPLMNFRLARPGHLVDITSVRELDYIRAEDGRLRIGAAARQAAVERDPAAAERAPLLVEALGFVGHEPIRHRGTVVGSLAHADPAAEIPAVALAMEAELTAVHAQGERRIAASEFFTGPFSTGLETGELLTEVSFPVWPPGTGHAFVEFARRHGDFAVAGAAVLLHLDGEVVDRVAIALCGVAGTPVRATEAERRLLGERPTPAVMAEAAEVATSRLSPASDVHGSSDYRRQVARAYVRRALALAAERARGGTR